ncbi:hypothetical protein H072_1982 [Dactylellina haptotyla CBS 200.50]|uniref:Nucleoporin Nup133/Nup155-like C-terminal domain-containing protein n=1 Tax=Dactylellina haptotyla (strain CBS 200.50) TaxID=1284197 RepID=S8BX06_DACHA|nr:hypothetical protein H072_1982 [Dactylellina haptotyla CBS 200.50]
MTDPSPAASQSQSNASFMDITSTQGSNTSNFGTQSRRRPRPPHQSQASIAASNSLHPQKKSRQRSVSAQRELNASPEAMAAVAAATMDVSSIRSLQDKKKGSVIEWAKTSKYCIAQLVGLPMELRDTGDNYTKRMSALTDQTSGNALLIKDHGVDVWRYDDVQLLPKPNHFPLPVDEAPGRSFGSPQPLGSLVSPIGSSDEAGLVVVMPVTGRIAYWDSVSSAMTEGLLQRRRGVEGALQLSSNEQANMITNIEPAGFIICTNLNRVVHLSLRDGVGKPVVQITTLKNIGSSVVGGLLGGLANAFKSGNIRKEIVAVRPGRVIGRAERELLVATSHGHLTRWEVSRNGAAVVLSDADLREQLLARVLAVGPSTMQSLDKDTFAILDVAAGQSTPEGANVLVLTSWDGNAEMGEDITHYTLVLVTLYRGSSFAIKKAHYISCFQSPLRTVTGLSRPRLYLPNPYRTAFAVFSRAVVLVSIVPEDMYHLQFEADIPDVSYDSNTGFEDVIDFKEQSRVEIIGSGIEELSQEAASFSSAKNFRLDLDSRDSRRKYYSPGVVVITKGAGVLKLTVFDAEADDVRPKPSPRPVPVKSKMELAVFFGINEKNLLNFNGRLEIAYPTAEVEQAARGLSMDILCSHGQYLSSFGPSIDIYLELRAQKLQTLAEYLRVVHRPISREIKWKLLWDAEKVAAARAVYRSFAQKQSAGKDLSEGLLREIITAFFMKNDIAVVDTQNPMREWFAMHLPNIWQLVPLLRESVSGGNSSVGTLVRRVHESNEIILTILSTAQAFRSQHAHFYGLETDLDVDGIANFQGLNSPPWSSSPDILTTLNRDIEVNTKILENPQLKKEGEAFAESILDQMAEMVEVSCRNFVERATWCETRSEPHLIEQGKEIRHLYLKERNRWIRSLADAHRADQAIDIAERYRDYQTLVELAFEEVVRINAYMDKRVADMPDSERRDCEAQRDTIITRLETYFERFGQDFAFVLYEYQVEMGNLKELLVQFPKFKKHLDTFLHSSSHYAKLQWINDVANGKYREAGQTLVETAESESLLWSQSVELSIGKLALMIGQSGPELEHISRSFDMRLKLIDIQQGIQAHVYLESRGAIDAQAATEVAFGAFGTRVTPYQSLRDIFKRNVGKVVTGQAMDAESTIDFLTLMHDEVERDDEEEDRKWFGAFQMALTVLAAAELDDNRKDQARKTIWRRLYLSENWMDILDPSHQNTSQIESRIMNTNAFEVLMYGYREGIFEENKASAPVAPSHAGFDQAIEFLRARFPENPTHWLQNLNSELKLEEAEVGRLINNNLEFWFPWMCETARKMVAEEAEEDEDISEQRLLTNGLSQDVSYEVDDSADAMDMS